MREDVHVLTQADWSEASINWEMSRIASRHWRLEEARNDCPLQVPEGAWSR